MSNSNNKLQPLLDYLNSHSLAELREFHAVRYKVVDHLVTLAYHQFEAKNDNEITNLCRGLVIAREDGSTNIDENAVFGPAKVLAFPFVRFFNYGQNASVDGSLKPVRIYNKLDGTLIIVYFDPFKDCWNVATRNVPVGSNFADNATHSFRELFEKAVLESYPFLKDWDGFGSRLTKGVTYVFELMTPENIVVIKHSAYKAALIGVRDADGNEKFAEDVAFGLGFDSAEIHHDLLRDFKSFDDLVKTANTLDPLVQEGYVILAANWQRLKIKSEKYCTFNKVHDFTKYDILNYILTGEIDDLYPMMQNEYHRNLTRDIADKVVLWSKNLGHELHALNQMTFDSRKDLALFLNGKNGKNALYAPYARDIFNSYIANNNNGKIGIVEDAQELVKRFRDPNTGRYQDSFLRNLFNMPGF